VASLGPTLPSSPTRIAAGLEDAKRSFRRVRGHADVAVLTRALDARVLDSGKEVA